MHCLLLSSLLFSFFFFFFNDTATTEIYTLSLHDALPICVYHVFFQYAPGDDWHLRMWRSEEHTSELQSRLHLVCRLLLEKKKKYKKMNTVNRSATPTRATMCLCTTS